MDALRNACRLYFSAATAKITMTNFKFIDDFPQVVERALQVGVQKFIITGGNLEDSRDALKLAQTREEFFSTVGCHPTRCAEFDQQGADQYLSSLMDLSLSNRQKVIAVGECGLGTSSGNLIWQKRLGYPCSSTAGTHTQSSSVHSFDGSQQDAAALVDLDLYIAKLIKTTFPTKKKWEAGHCVKDRNEPCHIMYVRQSAERVFYTCVCSEGLIALVCVFDIRQVLEVMAAVRGEDPLDFAETIYNNTVRLFFKNTL
ncbi:hypothetical protein H4Q32_030443 [Labeo rohita]|uniref:Deoxyribonuclease TATDN1 n=1 Tax=Labeo rohita TaxID=84645 RepID=A0ABQ8LTP1_LABRO|nr:hypothetical protein H4Q32_030443 [Labeo rohita]